MFHQCTEQNEMCIDVQDRFVGTVVRKILIKRGREYSNTVKTFHTRVH